MRPRRDRHRGGALRAADRRCRASRRLARERRRRVARRGRARALRARARPRRRTSPASASPTRRAMLLTLSLLLAEGLHRRSARADARACGRRRGAGRRRRHALVSPTPCSRCCRRCARTSRCSRRSGRMTRMLGSDAVLRALEHEGVRVAFGIPGGAILPTVRRVRARLVGASRARAPRAGRGPHGARATRVRRARSASRSRRPARARRTSSRRSPTRGWTRRRSSASPARCARG